MSISPKSLKSIFQVSALLVALLVAGGLQAKNQVLGRVDLVAGNAAAKDAGVWVDGQYVGYLKELNGSKKLLLLPGKHLIQVQESGYVGFRQQIMVEPGETQKVTVSMDKDPAADYSKDSAELKISGHPKRAAVFVDHQFVGHINQFDGIGQGMLLTPGRHQIEVALPGYQTFRTEIDLAPHQKLKLKTNLIRGGAAPSS